MTNQTINYKSEWYPQLKPNYKSFDKDSKYWDMKYEDRWLQMINYLDTENFVSPKLLEIGCGLGRASHYFKKYGAIVTGIEISDYAIENNRLAKSELIHGNILSTDLPKNYYDIIYIEQVLSHVVEFKSVIKKAYDALIPEGILAIEEPNDGSPLQSLIAKTRGVYWLSKDHLNYWNSEQLATELEDFDFNIQNITSTFPMELFELMNNNYIGDDLKGREVHMIRTDLMENLGSKLRCQLKQMFADMGWGRDTFIIAKK